MRNYRLYITCWNEVLHDGGVHRLTEVFSIEKLVKVHNGNVKGYQEERVGITP